MSERTLEVCAFSLETCLIAEKVGATRVELCDNPLEGGTTPSIGFIRQVRERLSIDLFPIIRPRGGNFCYTEDEYLMMKYDIQACLEMGCNGISIGVQTKDAKIDADRMKQIVDWAGPMQVTCHRVFDTTPDPFEALELVIDCGCTRILTSGQESTATNGSVLLAKLVTLASDRISIMPGSGVKSSNLKELIQKTSAKEYHTSAKIALENTLTYINPKVNDYGHLYVAEQKELEKIISILRPPIS
ncbi:MAG: copper homeostasis protein CutC [Pedobacter sp.]|nr:MAG: copper homeostasis protein CutC [Pedobacter sp.]